MSLTLILANKAYSSWSFRPWILLRHFGIAFAEKVIPLDLPQTRAEILKVSPSGKCPCLYDNDLAVWDSLAIIQYVAENWPQHAIWPKDKAARATARSVSAEMHSGFQAFRSQCPMNFFRSPKAIALGEDAKADVARIVQAWELAREHYGSGGPFLFGSFSAADAMYAPVVNRLHVYDVPVSPVIRSYMDAMMGLPAWLEWAQAAKHETWRIAKYEAI